jgi:hypothetical protein
MGCSFDRPFSGLYTRNLQQQNARPSSEHPMQLVEKEAAVPLKVSQAAAVLGRSSTWVRDRLTMGLLEKDPSSTPRRIMVTARSVLLAKRAMPERQGSQNRRYLRLIVDNTAKTD